MTNLSKTYQLNIYENNRLTKLACSTDLDMMEERRTKFGGSYSSTPHAHHLKVSQGFVIPIIRVP